MMSRFDFLKLEILHAIYDDAFRPGSLSAFSIDELGRVLPSELIFGVTQAVLNDLHKENYLYLDSDGYFSISNEGIRYIEFMFDEAALQNSSDQEATEGDPAGQIIVPASDRLVPLNHNSEPYKEAIEALDAAVSAFREDHSLSNEWGPEKNILLQSLEGGRQLLRETEVRAATVFATLITPLKVVRDKYQVAIVEGVVKATFENIIYLFGKAVSSLLKLMGIT